jgi:hypothetical protein
MAGRQPAPEGRLRRTVLAGLAAVAAVGVAGTAWATAGFLSGGGAQPEHVLPATVVAVAKVDFDPAAGQKLAVYRLAQRFPSTADDVTGQDDVKDQLLRSLFEGADDVDYDRDLAPWVGDRVAVAAMPVPGADPVPLLAVAHTGRAEADAALRRIDASDTFWAFSDRADYVLIAETQATVDAAVGAGAVLADSSAWADDVDALDGDNVVTAWADLGAVWRSLPDDSRDLAGGEGFEPAGRIAVGARAMSDGVEVVGRNIGVTTGSPFPVDVGVRSGVDLVQGLPDDVVAALGVTDLGEGLAQMWEGAEGDGRRDFAESAAEIGLELPEDLRVLFGEQTAAAVWADEQLAARSRTDDPERARVVVEKAAELLLGGLFGLFIGLDGLDSEGMPEQYWDESGQRDGELYGHPDADPGRDPYGEEDFFDEEGMGDEGYDEGYGEDEWPYEDEWLYEEKAPVSGSAGFRGSELGGDQVRVVEGGLVVGSSATAVDRMAGGDGGLGRSPLFRKALPDAADAGFLLYVDVQRAMALSRSAVSLDDEEPDDDLSRVAAVGMSATGGEDGTFRLRVLVR